MNHQTRIILYCLVIGHHLLSIPIVGVRLSNPFATYDHSFYFAFVFIGH